MARFNSAWWQIVKADPVTAIDALLAKCFGYFNPMDQPYVSMDYYVNSDYVTDQTTWIKYWCSEWRQSIAEGAKQFGEIPVLGWVAHGNLYVMMTLLIGAAEVVLRRWRTLVMHLPLLLLMGVMITRPRTISSDICCRWRSCSDSWCSRSGGSRSGRGATRTSGDDW